MLRAEPLCERSGERWSVGDLRRQLPATVAVSAHRPRSPSHRVELRGVGLLDVGAEAVAAALLEQVQST